MNRPTMGDIKPVKKTITPIKSEPIVAKNEPILNIRSNKSQNKIEEPFFGFQAKPKRIKEGKKLPKFIIITSFVLIIIYYCLYSFGYVNIVIIPKPDLRQINQPVRLDSWNNPLKTSVMSVNEKMTFNSEIESLDEAKKRLNTKLDNRLIYDMPENYMLIEKCKSEATYSLPTIEALTNKNITATMSVLIFEKKSLEDYLLKITNSEFMRIKDITKLSCELKSDISKTGTISKDISFNLSGDIVLLPIIDPKETSQNAVFKTYKNYKYALDTNTKIASYTINTYPWNIFPVLPKNIKRIHTTIRQ